MHTETLVVTPEQAQKWLDTNSPRQRSLIQRKVDQLSQSMERGEWLITHQGIALDTLGNLVDGQHRLNAVIMYGKPVEMTVTFDTPPTENIFHAIDTGTVRAPRQFMAPYGSLKESVLRAVFGWEVFDFRVPVKYIRPQESAKNTARLDQVMALSDRAPKIMALIEANGSVYGRLASKRIPAASATGLILGQLVCADPDQWIADCRTLADEGGLSPDNTLTQLAKRHPYNSTHSAYLSGVMAGLQYQNVRLTIPADMSRWLNLSAVKRFLSE